jgi:hypothetical protein
LTPGAALGVDSCSRGGGAERSIQPSALGNQLKQPRKNAMFPEDGFVKMSYFAIEFYVEMPYPLAPALGKLKTKDTKECKGDRGLW